MSEMCVLCYCIIPTVLNRERFLNGYVKPPIFLDSVSGRQMRVFGVPTCRETGVRSGTDGILDFF